MIKFEAYAKSQLSEGIPNPAFVGDAEIDKLDSWILNPSKFKKDKSDVTELLATIFAKYESLLGKTKSKFERLIKKEARKFKDMKILSDSKTFSSIVNKAIDRKRGIRELNDLVRGAILFKTKSDADEFVKKFIRRNRSIIAGVEEKTSGQDNTYGYYGSHHLDLNIDGIIVELQVMTKKLWSYKAAAHEIYNANRTKEDGPDAFDRHNSKKIFSMGNNESEGSGVEFTYEELYEMQFDEWVEVEFDSEDE